MKALVKTAMAFSNHEQCQFKLKGSIGVFIYHSSPLYRIETDAQWLGTKKCSHSMFNILHSYLSTTNSYENQYLNRFEKREFFKLSFHNLI